MNHMICMTCRTKTSVSNDIFRSRQLLNLIKSKTSKATEEQKNEARLKLRQNPHLRQLCHNTKKCKYGIHCPDLNLSTLNSVNEKICEELVLLSCIDKKTMLSFASHFRGDYPKAVAYINRQQY